MKYLFALSLITASSAFMLPTPARFGIQTSTALRADVSESIEAALTASRTFGATSKEAAVAWDIVEEINASDNRYVISLSEEMDVIQ